MLDKALYYRFPLSGTMITKVLRSGCILPTVWILLAAPLDGSVEELVDSLIEAHKNREPLPLVSLDEPGLTLPEAYEIQRRFVEGIQGESAVTGYKAGLTTEASRVRFGLEDPVSGILLRPMDYTGRSIVRLGDHRRMMIETEIAFIVGKPIRRPVAKLKRLKKRISAIAPAVELPDIGFEDPQKLSAVDLIAANVSAAGFIVGPRMPHREVDPGEVRVQLVKNGALVNSGIGEEAMGDPWKAAFWLTNHILSEGRTLEPGMVLLTGALGRLVRAEEGEYTARFSELGEIRLQVR